MEAVPRLPMINFDLKVSTENVQFGPQLKQYIASFYNEDPESYNTEIGKLEALRSGAVRPTIDISGCQLLKKYYCQLHFLKSRFPMAELQAAAVYFSWKDPHTNMPCGVPDIRFELMCILYNIGALHSQLGTQESRTSPEGMKMACTHFQCAAWSFQTIKENYYQMVPYMSSIEVIHFMQQVCLAQAQECILEKSMMDNRKATIIAKVAVQVVDYYKRSLNILQFNEESSLTDLVGSRVYKEWVKYLSFKVSYHKCIALLFQGQQAEEQQKMGERVAFYQAACEQLDEARKLSTNLKQQKEIAEALGFTSDVVEGKRKAAKNENEFIYHEEVPEKNALQEVKGVSLVKGIQFSVNDVEVSGPDIFARLVPMEAHEASSLYSEKKAQMLRQLAELVESKDQALAEFMSSLQLDVFNQMRQATGLSQDLVDRAAALSAKPGATQELVNAMGRLSNSYHEVEAMLNEIQELLTEEEKSEKEYQDLMGKRPPSIIATDLSREASKYREAHNKANDSNQNLHKAMMTHVANLKILAQPLMELQKQIPTVDLSSPNIDESSVREIEGLTAKVEEMRNQRAMLWTQFREAVHKDDITSVLVTRQADQPLDQLFQQELQKHQELASLIEQNAAAQENILKAFVDAYARSSSTRRYLEDIISKRNATVTALITSFDTYEDLLAKANKGTEFYNKLETNVSKLLQRIKSTSKVQQEEREQFLLKNSTITTPVTTTKEEVAMPTVVPTTTTNTAPKLKDYLESRKKVASSRPFDANPTQQFYPQPPENWPPAVRPTPVGSEINTELPQVKEDSNKIPTYPYQYPQGYDSQNLTDRLAGLRVSTAKADAYYPQQYQSYTPDTYANSQATNTQVSQQAPTATTDTYQTISSYAQNQQYQSMGETPTYQYPSYSVNYGPTATDYNLAVPNTQPNIYYPPGYNPASPQITPASNQNFVYPANYEYATSNLSGYVYSATYSSPAVDLKSSDSSGTGYAVDNTQQYYNQSAYSYYGATYPQDQSYSTSYPAVSTPGYSYPVASTPGYSYPTPDPSQTPVTTASYPYPVPSTTGYTYPTPDVTQTPVTTKSSNIDLLSGLDFTVTQAPLIPQQKSTTETKVTEQKTEIKKEVATKSISEEKPKTVEKIINRKPLNNLDAKKLVIAEVDKFEKFVDVLSNKTLSGPTNLDLKWKEIQDKQDFEKKAISVARCYPMKNRYPDILPYDYSRVELKGAKDDYINASYIRDVSYYGAPFIVTQAPLPSTFSDFWTMIRERNVELIVCLLGDGEINNEFYWPTEKGRDLNLAGMVISLMSTTIKASWTERLITISIPEKRDSRVVMHLQLTSWPGSLFPMNPSSFVGFVTEVTSLFLQQRNTWHPIVVHCSSGIGRSGLVCLLITAILEMTNNTTTVPDLVSLTVKLSAWRKNILRDREHLKFAYEALLTYMKQLITQGYSKKSLNEVVTTEEKPAAIVVEKKEIVDDPLSSLDPFWASKK